MLFERNPSRIKSGVLLLFVTFTMLSILSCQNQISIESVPLSPNISSFDTALVEVVELPRPNSGKFTFEEAEKRKGEIFEMQLSPKHFEWKNPTTGGAIHITNNDEIEVYQFTMGLMYMGKDVDANGDTVVIADLAPKDTSIIVTKEELKYHVGGIGMGNPASVLITSEYNLKQSKSLPMILDEVFEPASQIYYLKKK